MRLPSSFNRENYRRPTRPDIHAMKCKIKQFGRTREYLIKYAREAELVVFFLVVDISICLTLGLSEREKVLVFCIFSVDFVHTKGLLCRLQTTEDLDCLLHHTPTFIYALYVTDKIQYYIKAITGIGDWRCLLIQKNYMHDYASFLSCVASHSL